MRLRVWVSGFRFQIPGFRFRSFGVQVSGLGVLGPGSRVQGSGFRVQGLELGAQGSGSRIQEFDSFRVHDLGCRALPRPACGRSAICRSGSLEPPGVRFQF